jgi:ribonucleotide reductase alpha subunit
MKGLNDPIVKNLINKFKKINWEGFKLYLVGGILEEWETKDIDICILGELNSKQLFESMEAARKLGPFDLYYVNELRALDDGPYSIKFAKSYDRVSPRAKQRPGEWIDELFWQEISFPMKKHTDKNRIYTKPPLLIHDGTLEF